MSMSRSISGHEPDGVREFALWERRDVRAVGLSDPSGDPVLRVGAVPLISLRLGFPIRKTEPGSSGEPPPRCMASDCTVTKV